MGIREREGGIGASMHFKAFEKENHLPEFLER